MKKYRATLDDLSGGLNDAMDPSSIGPTFSTKLENFRIRGKELWSRDGIIRQTSSAHSERITGLFGFGVAVGSWVLLVGTQTGLYKLVSGTLTALTNTDSISIPSSDDPWKFRQYKNIVYGVRAGVQGVLRITENEFSLAGIDAPTTAVTLANTTGGTMEAGDRHVVMTFVNTNTDVESTPSPNSAAVTLSANDLITITNAEVPTDAQVNARRFYVELAGIPGQYYLGLETTDIASTGPFTIDKTVEQLGGLASFENDPPDEKVYVDLEVWKERLWLTDGYDVQYSQNIAGVGLAECFDPLAFISIFPDDRNRITAIRAFGDRLVVGKTNGVHAIVTSGDGFAVQTLSDKQGCPSGDTMRAAEGLLWWYSGENVYQTNGSSLENISDPPGESGSRVRELLDLIPDTYKSSVSAAVYPRYGWYVLSIITGSSSIPTHALIYDYRNRRWFVFKHATLGAPTVFGDFFDSYEQSRVFCAYADSNHIYDFIGDDDANDDDGEGIDAIWRSAGFDCGAPGYQHVMRKVGLLVEPIQETVTVRVYEEASDTASASRTGISLNQARQLQRISIPSYRSFHSQIEVEYSGAARLKLKALLLDADVWGYEEPPA